jgi:HSP20 family molecular chaperone IbpA
VPRIGIGGNGTPVAFPPLRKGAERMARKAKSKKEKAMSNALVYNPAKWLDQFFSDFDSNLSTKQGFAPAVDIVEDKEEFLLRSELPGVPKEFPRRTSRSR